MLKIFYYYTLRYHIIYFFINNFWWIILILINFQDVSKNLELGRLVLSLYVFFFLDQYCI